MNLIKKIKLFFMTKAFLISELGKLNQLIEINMRITIENFKELEQHKLYYISVDTDKEVRSINLLLNRLRDKIKWTLPTIIVINRPIEELTNKQLIKELKLNKKTR